MTPFHFLQEVIWAENAAFFGQEYFSTFLQDKSVQKSLSSCWTWVNTFNVTEPTDTINVWVNCSGRELPSFQSSSVCFFVVATNWNLSRDLIFLSALECVKFNENETPYLIEHFRLLCRSAPCVRYVIYVIMFGHFSPLHAWRNIGDLWFMYVYHPCTNSLLTLKDCNIFL